MPVRLWGVLMLYIEVTSIHDFVAVENTFNPRFLGFHHAEVKGGVFGFVFPLFLPFFPSSLLSSARGRFTGEGESDRVGPTRIAL